MIRSCVRPFSHRSPVPDGGSPTPPPPMIHVRRSDWFKVRITRLTGSELARAPSCASWCQRSGPRSRARRCSSSGSSRTTAARHGPEKRRACDCFRPFYNFFYNFIKWRRRVWWKDLILLFLVPFDSVSEFFFCANVEKNQPTNLIFKRTHNLRKKIPSVCLRWKSAPGGFSRQRRRLKLVHFFGRAVTKTCL